MGEKPGGQIVVLFLANFRDQTPQLQSQMETLIQRFSYMIRRVSREIWTDTQTINFPLYKKKKTTTIITVHNKVTIRSSLSFVAQTSMFVKYIVNGTNPHNSATWPIYL